MRKLMQIVLALMIVILAVSQPAHADRGGHGRHGGGHVGVGVYLGPGWWGPGWWEPYYYPYYPYYYSPPPVIVEQPSEIYVQPAPEAPRYWYYCKDPQGYYPTVKRCPDGWMKVVPPSPPSDKEE